MTALALLADLQKRDVVLAADGEALEVDAPCGALTPDLRAALVAHKAELLALLREPVATPEPVAGLPASRLTPEVLADWAARREVVTLRSRTLGGDVYLVPDAGAGAALVGTGVLRHRVYLPAELQGLVALLGLPSGPRAAAVRALDALREAFGPDLDVIFGSDPRCAL